VAEQAELLERRREKLEKKASKFSTIVRHHIAIASDEGRKLEHAYREKIRLSAPAEYWRGRARRSSLTAAIALAMFSILAVGMIFLLVYWWPDFKKFLVDKDGKIELGSVALLAPVVVILLWLFKMIARIHTTNHQQAEDARQRETMIATFLALTFDQSVTISDAERLVVLQALFRPSGARADDESLPSSVVEAALKAVGPTRH